jgi:hypothetical protein
MNMPDAGGTLSLEITGSNLSRHESNKMAPCRFFNHLKEILLTFSGLTTEWNCTYLHLCKKTTVLAATDVELRLVLK